MISKIQLAVLCVFVLVVSGLSIAVSSLRHERSLLLLEIERMNTELALSSQSLMQSNEAIARQNAEIRKLNAAMSYSESIFKMKLAQIESKYVSMADKAKQSLAKNSDCETALTLIRESQRGFLNE